MSLHCRRNGSAVGDAQDMRDSERARVRSVGFSRRPPSTPPPPAVLEQSEASGGAPPCYLCGTPTTPWMVTPIGNAICEQCAIEPHPLDEEAPGCGLCASPTTSLRGYDGRAVCEGCLSFSRAIALGDV